MASKAPGSASHRRRHPRVDSLGRCFAEIGGGWEASVLNLSLGGMLLRATRVLNPGSAYFIKLIFDERVAVVQARVVRLLSMAEEYLAGMEFLWLSPIDQSALQRFVEARARRS